MAKGTETSGTPHQNDWWVRAKIYELYIDKFAHDLSGLTAHLDYFNKLGIDCIHLLPHYPSPMDDDGYDVSDYCGVREGLGTVADLQNFFRTARAQGIRTIVDLVLNHVSVTHPWFIDARASRKSPMRDYFLWSEDGTELSESTNPFIDFKSSNWVPNPATNDYYFSTFKPSQADLNWDNPKVLQEILDIIDRLVELGAGGFRLDAIAHLVKREHTDSKGIPETHAMLKKIRAHMDAHHPGVILLGEVSGAIEPAKKYFGNGDECHLVYNFQLATDMFYALLVGDTTYLEKTRAVSLEIPPRTSWAAYLRNHDEINLSALDPERHRTLVELLDPDHRYPFNGGRDTSQRLFDALRGDITLIKNAFHHLYSTPSATVMYYGDEIGMKNIGLEPGVTDTRLTGRGDFDWEEARRQMSDPGSLWNAVAKMIKTPPLGNTDKPE